MIDVIKNKDKELSDLLTNLEKTHGKIKEIQEDFLTDEKTLVFADGTLLNIKDIWPLVAMRNERQAHEKIATTCQ